MPSFSLQDPYEVLGVKPDVTAGELRRAFRRLALRYHPDRAGTSFTSVFQMISNAYELLSDPERRGRYDRQRGHPAPASAAPESPPVRARASGAISRLITALEGLLATGSARFEEDGSISLRCRAEEVTQGGHAQISTHAVISCLQCAGAPGRVETCAACVGSGVVRERVTAFLTIPPGFSDGTEVAVPVDPNRRTPSLRFVLRHPESFANMLGVSRGG